MGGKRKSNEETVAQISKKQRYIVEVDNNEKPSKFIDNFFNGIKANISEAHTQLVNKITEAHNSSAPFKQSIDEVEAMKLEKETYAGDLKLLNQRIEMLDNRIGAQEAKYDNLFERTTGLEKESGTLRTTVADQAKEIDKLKGENEKLQATVADQAKEIDKLNGENEKLQATVADQAKEIDKLKGENEKLQATVDDQAKEIDKLKGENEKLQATVAELVGRLEKLEEKIK